MDFSTIKLFPDNLVRAIGNTLLHSLWQGMALAAVTGVIIVCTRKSSSARRYNLLIGALVLFAAAVLVTFALQISKPVAHQANQIVYNNIAAPNVLPAEHASTAAAQQPGLADKAIGLLNNNANTLVLIWFMVVCARCLQLATGLNGLYHLRRRSVFAVDKQWENRVQQLAVKLGIRRMVGIAESGLAKVPMVIGHLKPLILIPIGLMTALSQEEIEAILVHELAHIRRRDYLVNMLQSLMEIVFFFNPAVLWISALIKNERENCCDDIAVAQSSNKVNYIKALVSCQEYRMAAPAYAMAINGGKGHLVARVKRILSNNNQSLNRLEKSLLALCLVAAGLFTAAFSNAEKINNLVASAKKAITQQTASPAKASAEKPVVPEYKPAQSITTTTQSVTTVTAPDTIKPAPVKIFSPNDFGNGTCMVTSNDAYTSFISKDNGTFYQINYLGSTFVSLQVNGETISPSDVHQYQPQIASILDRLKHVKDISGTVAQGEPNSDANNPAFKWDDPNKAAAKWDTVMAKAKKSDAKLAKGVLGKLSYPQQQAKYGQQQKNYLKDAAIADSAHKAYKKTGISYKVPAMPPSPIAPATPAGYNWDDASRRKNAIDDMITEGLITTKDNLSFKLSTDEFIVNGKKQPQDVFIKYRAKYVKMTGHNEWTWYYNYDTPARRETSSTTDEPKN